MLLATVVALGVVVGCGGETNPPVAQGAGEAAEPEASPAGAASEAAPQQPGIYSPFEDTATVDPPREQAAEEFDRFRHPQDGPNLGDLLEGAEQAEPRIPELPEIEEDRVQAAGIRRIEGEHLILYTDIPPDPAIEELPAVYDLAVPQWCDYFDIDREAAADWKLIGCLMQDKERFRTAGLLEESVPQFLNGYQLGAKLWLNEQPSDYYRRHLLLHEGTHGFMNHLLGGCGPPWYMEGMAERLSTHRWEDGQLLLAYMPADNDEVPMWGRVKIVRDDYAAGRAKTLAEVMQYGPRAHLQNEPYGWCWAACTFFDEHPLTHERFRQLPAHVREGDFSAQFQEALGDDWPAINEAWQLFVANPCYGYDIAAEMIHYAPGEPLPAGGAEVRLAAAAGWQSTGYVLEAGRRYRISAEGSYTIAQGEEPWPCEPGGVTIRYENGFPLGMLLGAIRPDDWQAGLSPLVMPGGIGLERVVEPELTGTLYLRVNDSPAEVRENAGECVVRIEAE